MNIQYRHTNTTVSKINLHFVFCPRYRRKIFNIPNLEDRFKELVYEKCTEMDIRILAIECETDHCHLFVNVPCNLRPSDIMFRIKGYTGRLLRQEFKQLSKMPNLWTRSYFCASSGDVSNDTIKKYIENQKKSY